MCPTVLIRTENLHSPFKNIHCADNIGIFGKAAFDTDETGLGQPVLFRDMAAARTGLAGVMGGNRHHPATKPVLLVLQLTAKLTPSLIENGAIQPRFLPNLLTGLIHRTSGTFAHGTDIQILNHDHRVVFADGCRGLVQKVSTHIGYGAVNTVDPLLLFLPVGRELGLVLQPGWAVANFFASLRKLFMGSITWPSDKVAKRVTPTSTPTALVAGW